MPVDVVPILPRQAVLTCGFLSRFGGFPCVSVGGEPFTLLLGVEIAAPVRNHLRRVSSHAEKTLSSTQCVCPAGAWACSLIDNRPWVTGQRHDDVLALHAGVRATLGWLCRQ